MEITAKVRGPRASILPCNFCFRRNLRDIVLDRPASIFRPAALAADWAAKVLEAAPVAVKVARALGLAYLALAFSTE